MSDLGAIKADLKFLIERVARFRKEQALKPLYTMIRSTAIGGRCPFCGARACGRFDPRTAELPFSSHVFDPVY